MAAVEVNLDILLVGEFGLLHFIPPEETQDEHSVENQLTQVQKQSERKEIHRVDLLVDLPFNKKLEFLREIGTIKKEEYAVLRQFQRDRNRCFHGEIWGSPLNKLSNEEKALILSHVEKALATSNRLMSRMISRLLTGSNVKLNRGTPGSGD